MDKAFDSESAASLLRQQESLREVIESISSELELRPLLTRIVRHACELLDADNGTIGLVDTERNIIRTEAAYRMPEDEIGAEMEPGIGLAGQVFRARQPIVLDRYGELENPTQEELVGNAVIGVPIFWHEQLIGFFGLGSPPPRRFTAQDVEALSLFAKHAAIAIENARLFTGMQNGLIEMQLLYETSRRISVAITIEEVVAAYLEQVAARRRYACTIVLYEKGAEGQKLAVLVRGRWTAGEGMTLDTVRIPYTYDALDPPLDLGQTVTIPDVHSDPRVSLRLREIQRQSRRPALALIPLMARGERIGLVILSYPQIHAWPEADLRPYQATAAQLATALDSRGQHILLSERGQQVAVLEERHRIARELHDSVTQLLFSITLIAQTIAPAWRRDPDEGERRVQRMLELSQSALAEMRGLLAKLHPPETPPVSQPRPQTEIERIRQEGLAVALCKHCEHQRQEGLHIALDVADYTPLSPEREEALYRIAQEALHNVVKHARTDYAEVCLRVANQTALLIVKDCGTGMSPEAAERRTSGGLGLATMRERAQALGGTVQILSAPGRGTTVEATLPTVGEETS